MAYPAKAIANYFLGNFKGICPMKLQKLVYFAHGWHLAINGEPLINESIEAWNYGPVIPALYHEFKKYGNKEIPVCATTYSERLGDYVTPTIYDYDEGNAPEDTQDLLSVVWEVYGKFSALQLSSMTHLPGTPWRTMMEVGEVGRNVEMDDDIIEEYFKKKIKNNE